MAAIAGVIGQGWTRSPADDCQAILARLVQFGRGRRSVETLGHAAFGHNQHCIVPQDAFERQPLIGGGGTVMLTADVRIDNRDELSATLGISSQDARERSESALLLTSWERWGLRCADHLVGDYAFAIWDETSRQLILVRGPMALKPLFFVNEPGTTAFASMPMALFALSGLTKRLNVEEAARTAADIYVSNETLFQSVFKVPHGHAVIVTPGGGTQTVRLWELKAGMAPSTVADAGEGMRFELDRAVRAQLRRISGPVAAQLSAGRDSSAVAATAAMALNECGERLIAVTGAPRLGFVGGGDDLIDEAPIAALTASMHPNIDQFVCRAVAGRAKEEFDFFNASHSGPMLGTYNTGWSNETFREASRHGATVILGGGRGNFSISRGGFDALRQTWQEQGLGRWLRTASAIHAQSNLSWRTLGHLTFGPDLPAWLHRQLLRLTRRGRARSSLPMLRGNLRSHAEGLADGRIFDQRPVRSHAEHVHDMIFAIDNADQVGIAEWGIEERDPTADRRVVEYCYSLTTVQLVSAESPRPAYEAAFSDRVPREVIAGRRRGFQGADCYEIYRPEFIRPLLADYARNPAVAELIDFDAAERLMSRWPTSGSETRADLALFAQHFLNTISLAGYIAHHFD